MKIFIVNVNNCLSLSQYAPFFYEHIYKGKLVMLDEISDTCELDETYKEILAHINRNPFSMREGVVFLFIPRDFSAPLRPQDYELYNDINTYMHLAHNLQDSFRFYTFYVDKTGELELNDAVYQQLKAVSHGLRSNRRELNSHFLNLPDQLPAEGGDYKDYLRRRIADLAPCTRAFYEHMLQSTADIVGDYTTFRNAIHHYIGEARVCLSEIRHVHTAIRRDDLSDDIETRIKIIYYIKALIEGRHTLDNFLAYEDFRFDDYDRVRRLIVTYRARLSKWTCEHTVPSPTGKCKQESFTLSAHAAAEYKTMVDKIIESELKSLSIKNVANVSVVDSIFDRLSNIVSGAWEALETFTAQEAKSLFDPNCYTSGNEEEFPLDQIPAEESLAEKQMLEQINQHSEYNLPDFSAENRLEQELELINRQINHVLDKLSVYRIGAFALSLVFAVLAVAGLYCGAQYSIFLKEDTWWVFLLYTLITGGAFSMAYFTVRRRYCREIEGLLIECKKKVERFLSSFQMIAEEFENNLRTSGQYACMKRYLDAKNAARLAYQQDMKKYFWHKMKVEQILKNLSYFDPFVRDAVPYDENPITLESYDHDPEHTEFYQMKVF